MSKSEQTHAERNCGYRNYCICDDLLKFLNYQDNSQCRMSAAEIMTAALTVAAFFGGDHEARCNFLKEYRYITRMISKNRFSRRLAGIPEFVWRTGLPSPLTGQIHCKFILLTAFLSLFAGTSA
jgi:hypothetical protein